MCCVTPVGINKLVYERKFYIREDNLTGSFNLSHDKFILHANNCLSTKCDLSIRRGIKKKSSSHPFMPQLFVAEPVKQMT